ncbi:MAG: hypothetical protein QGI75_02430 [Phycisphaerales bacterium]|jgi:hypothetical protein|nr:hypothetical protein [Phycisphaerales bacterium]
MSHGPSGELVQMFQWFPNGDGSVHFIARRVSDDNGQTWSDIQGVQWSGGPTPHSPQADPSLVLLDDGTWRLYFTCQVGEDEYPATWSATSAGGVHFTWEDGKRMELSDGALLDPSIIYFDGLYHFYAPRPGISHGAIYATSPDGLSFTRHDDVVVKGRTDTKFLGNPVVRNGSLMFFGTLEPKQAWAGIFSAESDDGVNWTVRWQRAGSVADPAVAVTPSGVLVFVTSLQGPG